MARLRLSTPERKEMRQMAHLISVGNWFVLMSTLFYGAFNRGIPWGSLGFFLATYLLYTLLYGRWHPPSDLGLLRKVRWGSFLGAILITPGLAATGGPHSPFLLFYFPTIMGLGLGFSLSEALLQAGLVIALYLLLMLTQVGFWLQPMRYLGSGLSTGLLIWLVAVVTAVMGGIFRRQRRELWQAATQADLLSRTDPLTGLWNRREYADSLKREFSRAARHGHPLSIIMVDLDDFKSLNDHLGHTVGDQVLRQLGRLMIVELRQEDMAARYGGEEIVILLPDTSLTMAQLAAERLRKQVEKQLAEWSVTASMGVASFPSPTVATPEDLVNEADRALYLAKACGRNRTQTADSEIPHAL